VSDPYPCRYSILRIDEAGLSAHHPNGLSLALLRCRLTLRTSENSLEAKIGERPFHALEWIVQGLRNGR
jgi:hypothetical protein